MSLPPDGPDEVEADQADAEHRRRVDRRMERALNEGAATWAELLAAAEGADPRLVARRLAVAGRSIAGLEATAPPPSSSWSPELHARDFEWYFTPECADALARRAMRFGRRVLCLGTPTVAFALLEHPPLERLTLVDRNPLVGRRHPRSGDIETIHDELAAIRLEAGSYDVVIFDAPWYPSTLHHWLAIAARAVRPGGHVLFALLPRLHRPNASHDRETLLAEARRMGTIAVDPGTLAYQSPRFEQEALAAAGLSAPPTWRRADLAEVQILRTPTSAPDPEPTERAWARFAIGDQVVHLDLDAPHEAGDVLTPIDERSDFRYTSISTRDPRRARIGLWTSRSRVARVRRPDVVAALLERLMETGDLRSLDGCPALGSLEISARLRLQQSLAAVLGASVRESPLHGP